MQYEKEVRRHKLSEFGIAWAVCTTVSTWTKCCLKIRRLNFNWIITSRWASVITFTVGWTSLLMGYCRSRLLRKQSFKNMYEMAQIFDYIHEVHSTSWWARCVRMEWILISKYAMVFDDWTTGTTHYLSVFVTFPRTKWSGYSSRLLTISSIGGEADSFLS